MVKLETPCPRDYSFHKGSCIRNELYRQFLYNLFKQRFSHKPPADPSDCPIGRFLHNGSCTDQFWSCNSVHQPLEVPCANRCFSDEFCLKNEKCEKIPEDHWSCDQKCEKLQTKEIPCDGVCPDGFSKVESKCLPSHSQTPKGNMITFF